MKCVDESVALKSTVNSTEVLASSEYHYNRAEVEGNRKKISYESFERLLCLHCLKRLRDAQSGRTS